MFSEDMVKIHPTVTVLIVLLFLKIIIWKTEIPGQNTKFSEELFTNIQQWQ